MADKLKVLIVDDDPLFRAALTKYIDQNEDLTVVAETSERIAALRLAAKLKPDIVLVDILGFEGAEGGIQVIREIKEQCPELPVLAMSSQDASLYAQCALDAGAGGYLMKQESASQIGRVIHLTVKCERYVSDEKKLLTFGRRLKSIAAARELKQYKLALKHDTKP